MSADIYEYLHKMELTPGHIERMLEKWSLVQMLVICKEISDLLPHFPKQKVSKFTFIASTSLGGGPNPCAAEDCRFEHVKSLMQFSCLYADQVLIPDPFERIIEDHDHDATDVQIELETYIAILYKLRPLIENGIIKFAYSEHLHLCIDCYSKLVSGTQNTFRQKLDRAFDYLKTRFINEAHFRLMKGLEGPYVMVSAPEILLEHGKSIIGSLSSNPLNKKLKGRIFYDIDVKSKSADEIIDHYVRPVLDDVLLQNWYSNRYGCNYLTAREIDLNLISNINDENTNGASLALSRAFGHSLPMIENISIDGLLKLRTEEAEAFHVYRDALSKGLETAGCNDGKLYQQIFDDIVRPEVNKIDSTIKNSRKLLKESIRQDIVFGAGFVSVGLFSGILPSNIGQILAALGGYTSVYGLLDKTNQLFKEPPEIRDNKYYFLWKVQNRNTH